MLVPGMNIGYWLLYLNPESPLTLRAKSPLWERGKGEGGTIKILIIMKIKTWISAFAGMTSGMYYGHN
jgi:hypothetical protein